MKQLIIWKRYRKNVCHCFISLISLWATHLDSNFQVIPFHSPCTMSSSITIFSKALKYLLLFLNLSLYYIIILYDFGKVEFLQPKLMKVSEVWKREDMLVSSMTYHIHKLITFNILSAGLLK